ncbi:hypothetical protein C2845_PM06G33790 [Panicum miliaceum]|uniref:Uncharacterized protein n=1 Tax=Panicum miliaceum TaxID=4540 RepID=A0A3L6REB1_PANMI|nr:hypothetical protein C2845_PM06G33790 [Panicum miliaceum]
MDSFGAPLSGVESSFFSSSDMSRVDCVSCAEETRSTCDDISRVDCVSCAEETRSACAARQ